jgi:hypothetical protein
VTLCALAVNGVNFGGSQLALAPKPSPLGYDENTFAVEEPMIALSAGTTTISLLCTSGASGEPADVAAGPGLFALKVGTVHFS